MITEWEVFLAVVAIAGFIGIVFKLSSFVNELKSGIMTLNNSMQLLNKAIDEIAKSNKASHERLWDHNEEQDKQLSDHEKRIGILERLEE